MKVLVIGAGAGGAAATAELTLAGHEVTLWGRSAETVAPFQAHGVAYEGVLGDGVAVPHRVTTDLAQAVRGTEVAVVTLPTLAHAGVARALAAACWGSGRPVVLNPAHTGGVLEFTAAYRAVDPAPPPIVGFSTLAYVARKPTPDLVRITGRAKSLRAAALPGGRDALPVAAHLFPGAFDTGDVLASDLANVNMVLHPPGAVLGAAWVEATGGDFTFYVQGMTPGVARVMRALDHERLAVAAAYGLTLPNLIQEMQRIGTAPVDAPSDDYRQAIASGEANRRIKAPESFRHRYYAEDFHYGLLPFQVFAAIAGVATPIAGALLALGSAAMGAAPTGDAVSGATRGRDPAGTRRDARAMGIEGWDRADLLRLVRG